MSAPAYDRNVFINCPFDRPYKRIFDALVFVVFDCGFVARSALEITNTAEIRVEKIARIIGECRFGLHDLSRTSLDRTSRLPSPGISVQKAEVPQSGGIVCVPTTHDPPDGHLR